MKLLTHNMLESHLPGVTNGHPFVIEAHKVGTTEAEFEPEFIKNLFRKLDWNAFRSGATAMGLTDFPETVDEDMLNSDEFLRKLHHGLLEVTLVDGYLICPKTGHRFSVSNGIPNLLLPLNLDLS